MPTVFGRRSIAYAAAMLLVSVAPAFCQNPAPRARVTAVRTAERPVIDGRVVEECWSTAEPATTFTQRDPDEGMPATEHTELRVLYDDDALYVAVRLFDSDPGQVGRRLSNRDADADADRITIYLDSMGDRRTGASFGVSASNVQKDASIFNDTQQDGSWDAVWQSEVTIDESGWSVEMRIPLSQLRFTLAESRSWGINAERFIRRKNETVWLERVPKSEAGLASRMGDLTGLGGLRPGRRLEFLPYAAARAEFVAPEEAADPFNDGARAFGAVGIDLKLGLSSNLTLDATANPDFGQVEVDPAVVNLTAFETFFPEKRGFFLEGAQIFSSFGQGGANNFWGFNVSDPAIFYSRRIGRAPQVGADGDFVDEPAAATILGAVKLTGQTSGGWSIGLLEAVTGRETARTAVEGAASDSAVEPLTHYAVARMQRAVGQRGGAGFIATSVVRRLDDSSLRSALADRAHVLGMDGHLFLDGRREWVITGKISGSRVNGTAEAIDDLQRASQRYFQRPDAGHVTLDPTRTSLTGWAGRVNLNRNSGLWHVNAALWGVSPGFESNDVGFQGTGDRAGGHGVFMWRGETPNRLSRSRSMWVAKAWTWNYGRELQDDMWFARGSMTFHNYWNVSAGGNVHRRALDDRLTRGGPTTLKPRNSSWSVNGGTDARRWISVQANANRSSGEAGDWRHNGSLTISIKPSETMTLSTGPEWSRSHATAQYVTTVDAPAALHTFGRRYVFGRLDQTQVSMTTRLSVILTPRVSVQVFAQPLLAAGDYSAIGELARPRSFEFAEYGGDGIGHLRLEPASATYTVDPDGPAGAPEFSFDDPDFSLRSLRLNAVFRWEITPGSAFYLVWTRQQEDRADPGRFALGRDARRLFSAPGDDVVLVKLAYWVGK